MNRHQSILTGCTTDMYHITTFYKFTPVTPAGVTDAHAQLFASAREFELGGAIILGTEGCNGTVAGSSDAITATKALLSQLFGVMPFKDSTSRENPFVRFKIKVKEEIVTMHRPDLVPGNTDDSHITPTEWNKVTDEEDVVILDARNFYETKLGVFEKAIDPQLNHFKEFPEYATKADIPKTKKVLMYCTGGIRCEKAVLAMKQNGYQKVYQLQGGILQYLAEFPNGKFQGECFVFDNRIAVDQQLRPSTRFRACPHCGDPGDQQITCALCSKTGYICVDCLDTRTCSKNCSYHYWKHKRSSIPTKYKSGRISE